MRVLVKKPGAEEVQSVEIKEDSLEDLQHQVEGYIEFVRIAKFYNKGISILVNEEGLLQDLTPNIIYSADRRLSILVGNVLFTGTKVSSEGYECCSLTEEQGEFIKENLNLETEFTSIKGNILWRLSE